MIVCGSYSSKNIRYTFHTHLNPKSQYTTPATTPNANAMA